MIPFARYMSARFASIQRKLMKVKDRRINTTSEALEGMKLIKLQSWEKAFLQRISGIRCEEISILRKSLFRVVFIVGTCSGRCCHPPYGTLLPTWSLSPPSPPMCSLVMRSPRQSPLLPSHCCLVGFSSS